MAATYWVPASDALMDAGPQWPEGIRPVERGGAERPGMRWWRFEDDAAPETLNGKEVEWTASLVNGELVIADRRSVG